MRGDALGAAAEPQGRPVAVSNKVAIWTGKIELTSQQVEYLSAMKRTGLYGATVDEVVVGLILAGIRDAVERDFIKLTER